MIGAKSFLCLPFSAPQQPHSPAVTIVTIFLCSLLEIIYAQINVCKVFPLFKWQRSIVLL